MKYLNDSNQYAVDLTSAVEANDWEGIKNTQATLAAETMTAMLNQAAQSEQGKPFERGKAPEINVSAIGNARERLRAAVLDFDHVQATR